jgi:putative peptide zinc metalloprotease protein
MSQPLSSIHRPLSLRLRPDLQATPVEMGGVTSWIVKDPLALEHFQFSAEEHAMMDWLRRPTSIAQLQRLFEREFAPQTIAPEAVWDFLRRLHEAGLLIGDAPGQGTELLARMRRERAQRWAMAWTSLLAMRFRGVDPDRFLTAVHRHFGWLFSKAAAIGAVALLAAALWLVVGHFDEFSRRLPSLAALADARNLPWLLLAIGGVKVLHELGHALACKHFGGEVRELGVLLLVFVPSLYCDVSDAWRLPNKWRRITVSAAGIMVELALAALATIVWWYAQPGIVQLVAMNVMIVGSVNTLLVNGNPLMRYDGYHILSDLAEAPNLWQRSRDVLRRMVSNWLGSSRAVPHSDDPLIPQGHRPWLVVYALASKAYLVLVLVAIVWGLLQALYPYHLQNLAYAVGLTVVASALVGPARQALEVARNPLRRRELRTGRVALIATLGLAALVGVLSLPVTYHVRAPLVLMPEDAARVYATIEGRLHGAMRAGTRVHRGQMVAQLENTQTVFELARLEGEQRLRQMRVEHLERLRGVDREANDELPTARAALDDIERRLAEQSHEAKRLALVAPKEGFIIPAPRQNGAADWRAGLRLATWSGSLLDSLNEGAHVEPGTLVCLVGDPARLEAVLLVDDTDIKRIEPGQPTELRIEQLPGRVIGGQVVDVARHHARDTASDPAARGELAELFAGLVAPGKTVPLYQVRVRFDSPETALIIGGRGEAKIVAERITLARRILRYFAHTFRLPV